MLRSSKKWVISFLAMLVIVLSILGTFTIVVDPFFHYHKPLESLAYPINNERYQNNGILKHFDYDAIITGTSMCENFKTSEFDELFHVHSVKTPFSGATYKEINDNLAVAVAHNDNIRIILRGLDYYKLMEPADTMRYGLDTYPWHLYDDTLFNDSSYIFNKSILLENTCEVISYTRSGGQTTDFDSYMNWMANFTFGKEAIKLDYERPEKVSETVEISEQDYAVIRDTLNQNVFDLAVANPQIEFYLFFPPYSIFWWDKQNQNGNLNRQLEAEKYAIELILQYDNIHLFSFFNEYDIICDVENYKDITHYNEDINSQILIWISNGTHEITAENYEAYCAEMKEFYGSYDYDKKISCDLGYGEG